MNRIDPKLAATLRQPAELVERGLAKATDLVDLERVAARYAIAVTPEIAGLIDTENPDDPIARQFIPSVLELVSAPSENADPIGDYAHSPVSGIVHRYPDRVLLLALDFCSTYCRYCTRSRVVGHGELMPNEARLEQSLECISLVSAGGRHPRAPSELPGQRRQEAAPALRHPVRDEDVAHG